MPTLQALPALSDNYIWIVSGDDGRALVVDPGAAAPVLAAIDAGLRPIAILLTHHHPDHIDGAATLLEHHDIPCIAPVDPRIDCATRRVVEGDTVAIPEMDLAFTTLEVHGHTRSHIAYHGEGLVFCGDTLFSLGCGRMFEGTPVQMLASLDKLAALPDHTRVCCGHEYTLANGAFASVVDPDNEDLRARIAQARAQRECGEATVPSTMASERACNPFLRVDTPAVRASVAAHAGTPCADRVATFAALRGWKDGFRA
ncbi:MAG: hydroxyacylglutathione hydrolase [Proteobacteria bacterium]|nr:hydroxyacylglutathione hydrolase [Pseudomonadota bacterium]